MSSGKVELLDPPPKSASRLDILQRIKQVPNRIKNAPPKKFGKVGAGLILGGIGFGWLAFPYILDFAVARLVNLGEGSDVRKVWKKIPQHFDFNVYIFNTTNPEEVQNGGIPVLQEIGPYCYKEWKEKVNLVDDVDSDTITYSNMNTWYFQKEKSAPLTGNEVVVVPHLPLLSVLLVAENDFPAPMLSVVNAALPKIYGKLDTVFMTAKVRELLFDGTLIDCQQTEIVPKTVCLAIKQNSKPLVKLGKNRYLFSFFGIRNATAEDIRITVMKGTRNVYEIGKMMAINGKPENFAYPSGECNKLTGTDATIFPPFRKPDNTSIVAFSTDICRALMGVYEGEGVYEGIKGHKYVVTLGDMKNNPGEACFCNSRCLDKGAVDLTKCVGAPVIVTLPHFYQSHEGFLENVKGLNPQKDKHELTFIMEPISGVPLLARKRVQFNVPIHPVRYVNLTKNLKPTLVPIFWLEENLDLGGELMGFLEANLLTNLRLVDFVKWTLIVVGVGVGIGGLVVHRLRKEAEKKKTESTEDLLPASPDGIGEVSNSDISSSGSDNGRAERIRPILTPRRMAPRGRERTPPSYPDILDAGRLSEVSDSVRSEGKQVQPVPAQRTVTGVGFSQAQEELASLWSPKITPVESLRQNVAASAPLDQKPRPKGSAGSGHSLGKLGLF